MNTNTFPGANGEEAKQKLWRDLATLLNAIPGATKDVEQWKKVSISIFCTFSVKLLCLPDSDDLRSTCCSHSQIGNLLRKARPRP